MAIKAIIFDCFGVLLNQDGITSLFKDFPEYDSAIYDLFKLSDNGKLPRQQLLEAISEVTKVSFNNLVKKYFNFNNKAVFEKDVINWATQIKNDGKYKVGMLSNVGIGWLDYFLNEKSVKGLFDAYVLSCDEGITKPNPQIYKTIAKRIGCKSNECVMIDDRPNNIKGAKTAGMMGILFTSTKQAKSELKKILGE